MMQHTLQTSNLCLVGIKDNDSIEASAMERGCFDPVLLLRLLIQTFAAELERMIDVDALERRLGILYCSGAVFTCVIGLDGVEEVGKMCEEFWNAMLEGGDRDVTIGERRVFGEEDILEGLFGNGGGTYNEGTIGTDASSRRVITGNYKEISQRTEHEEMETHEDCLEPNQDTGKKLAPSPAE